MFSLEIEFLNGVSYASKVHEPASIEWPPHPDRLFAAFVSSWGESGKSETEADALRWLERQDPPDVLFPNFGIRDTYQSFVPTTNVKKQKSLVDVTNIIVRKDRYFPAITLSPDNATVYMVWKYSDPENKTFKALADIAGRVARLGHTASLVRIAANKNNHSAEFRYVANKDGYVFLRCPYNGRFDEMRHGFESSINSALQSAQIARRQTGPSPPVWHPNTAPTYTYIEESRDIPQGVIGIDWITLVCRSIREESVPTVIPNVKLFPVIAKAMRDTIIKYAPQPVHSILSGHSADKQPLQEPHLAFIPLANVGWRHSDGRLLGFALALPRKSRYGSNERKQLHYAISKFLQEGGYLVMGQVGKIKLKKQTDDLKSLLPNRYVEKSRTWTSVTPVVLDRYPKATVGKRPEDIIARSCTNVGLPEPTSIKISRYSSVTGSPPAHNVSQSDKDGWSIPKNRRIRFVCHTRIAFDTEIAGPIILGSGRYYGMGLHMRGRGHADDQFI